MCAERNLSGTAGCRSALAIFTFVAIFSASGCVTVNSESTTITASHGGTAQTAGLTPKPAASLAPVEESADFLSLKAKRESKFQRWLQEHAEQEAEVRRLLVASDVQVSSYRESERMKYAADTAKSAALDPSVRAQVRDTFRAAFDLWQKGEFSAARIGFERALALDPANPSGNFYYAETLSKLGVEGEIRWPYYDRAAKLGPGTGEALRAEAALAKLDEPYESKVFGMPGAIETLWDCAECPELAIVPAGILWGAPNLGEDDELMGLGKDLPFPKRSTSLWRKVRIPKPFAVGRYEVSVYEWAEFVKEMKPESRDCIGMGLKKYASRILGTNQYTGEYYWSLAPAIQVASWRSPGFSQDLNHPAVCVGDLARAYVEWLSKKTGFHYRLLNESEWHYLKALPHSDFTSCTSYNLHDPSFIRSLRDSNTGKIVNSTSCNVDDGFPFTSPVGSYPPDVSPPMRLFDVYGNIDEVIMRCDKFRPDSLSRCKDEWKVAADGSNFTGQISSIVFNGVHANWIGIRVARDLE